MFTSQAAIFVQEKNNLKSQTIVSVSSDAPAKQVNRVKKAKKNKEEKADKVNKFAKWGFIFSLIGFVSLLILPFISFALLPLGIGFSIAGLSATSKNKSRGKGLALAGLSIGSAGIFIMLIVILFVLAFFANWSTG
jgi:hypothetical protein